MAQTELLRNIPTEPDILAVLDPRLWDGIMRCEGRQNSLATRFLEECST
jgi:hypothetical protein